MCDLTDIKLNNREMAQFLTKSTTEVAYEVTRLSDVISCLRTELNKDLPIQHIALILAVVQLPGISMQDLMEQLNMPQGSVSRNVKLLSDHERGYGLLSTIQNEIRRKQVVVYPTQKCLDLIEKICRLMQVEIQEEPIDVCRCVGTN